MSTKPYYRFFIKDSQLNNGYYYLNSAGFLSVSQTADNTTAIADPDGWADIEIKIGRSKKYAGLQTEYIADLKFVKEAATILRTLFYAGGVEVKVSLYVEELNHTTQQYQPFFTGRFDFTHAIDSQHFFQADIFQDGVVDKLRTNEDVEYAIDVDGADLVDVTIPATYVKGEFRYLTAWPIPAQGSTTTSFTSNSFNYRIYAPLVAKNLVPLADTLTNEPASTADPSTNQYITGQRYQEATSGTSVYPPSGQYNFLFKANTDLRNVKLDATIAFYIDNNTGLDQKYRGRLWLIDSTGVYDPTYLYQIESQTLLDGNNYSFSLVFNPPPFDVPMGKRLIMQFGFDGPAGNNEHNVAWEKDNYIYITFEHKTTSFNVTGIRYYNLMKRLLSKMTDNTAILNSPIFTDPSYSRAKGVDTRPYNWIVLCGDSIRGTSTSPAGHPLIKTRWTDLFQDATSKLDIGMSIIGNTVRVAPRREFFNKDAVIFDMGDVTDVDIQPAVEHIFQNIQVGYKDQEYDQLNGRNEYNAGQTYLMPTINKAGDLNLVSPYSHSQFAIYNQWINYKLDPQKNSKTDNEIFIIEVGDTSTGGYYFPNVLSGTVTGVIDPDNSYNLALTPHHNLVRNGGRIHSGTYRQDNGTVKFQKADRNAGVTTNFGNGYYNVEYANIDIANLQAAYFLPISFTVEKTVPVNLTDLVAANPEGCIKFNWRGLTWKLFPDEVGTTPARPKKGTVKGLATPDLDLRNLA